MKNKSKVRWLVVIAGVAGALLLFFATRSDEPTYGGRRLTYWLGKLYFSDDKGRVEANDAIRAMGTNAVPRLIRMLPERDTAWKVAYNAKVLQLLGNDRARPFLMGGRSRNAALALSIIGPAAKQAVPFLIQNMTNTALGGAHTEYAMALSSIGADSILPLTQTLSHPDRDVRGYAWFALCLYDTNLVPAIPQLILLAKSQDEETRAQSIRLLGFVSGDTRALSVLVESLKDSSDPVRYWAAQGLAGQGAKARSALPALIESLNDRNTDVQAAVRFAITEIDTSFAIERTQVPMKVEQEQRK